MLASHPIDPMLLATDLAVARDFYGDRIGLEVSDRGRRLPDLRMRRRQPPRRHAELDRHRRVADQGLVARGGPGRRSSAELRGRGVEVEDITDAGFALVSWFVDPHGNTIGLLQFK